LGTLPSGHFCPLRDASYKKGKNMEQMQREEISEKDITIYVDMLLQKHRFLYDKRVAPLLYEFFLRSHKTFNWSKDEFLDKYINFDTNVKKIRFKKRGKI